MKIEYLVSMSGLNHLKGNLIPGLISSENASATKVKGGNEPQSLVNDIPVLEQCQQMLN